MNNAEFIIKSALLSKVEAGASWEEAYGKLIGAYEKSVAEHWEQAEALRKKLESENEPENYIKALLEPFSRIIDRETLYSFTASKLQAENWKG